MKRIIIIFFTILLFGSCEKAAESASNNVTTSKGGSMARFLITANALYVVDNNSLKIFDISRPGEFAFKQTIYLQSGVIETIFKFNNNLFIGSQTGMYIFSLADPLNPKAEGQALHMRSCDPVVANSKYAFVTLRSGAPCGTATDGLYIYDIVDIKTPVLKTQFNLASPYGLALNDNILYVNQGANGMAVIDVTDPLKPTTLKTVKDYVYIDSILDGPVLISYITDGVALYDISDPKNPVLLKKVSNI